MSFLMPEQALAAVIETILNQAFAKNIKANTSLHSLNTKRLRINLKELLSPICLQVSDDKMLVISGVQEADCQITTSLKSLWQLKETQQLTELIKNEQLDIQGDIKVAQQFAGVFENITIDWQSELAQHIGDIPTYRLGQLGKWLKQKASFAKTQIESDASEYLVYEKKLLVTEHELSYFYQQVADVEKATTHLADRIKKLAPNKK